MVPNHRADIHAKTISDGQSILVCRLLALYLMYSISLKDIESDMAMGQNPPRTKIFHRCQVGMFRCESVNK